MAPTTENNNNDDDKTVVTVIHCWSAPRSRSTALLYSFEARGDDTLAIDEPLYREWLIQKKESVERPYSHNLIQGLAPNHNEDEDDVDSEKWNRERQSLTERIQQAILHKKQIIFCKHMSKHAIMYNLEQDLEISNVPPNISVCHRHVLLIRDPVAVLSSWKESGHVHGHSPTIDEVSIVPLLAIYSTLESHAHLPVVLLDSDDLVANPQGTLAALCRDLDISYMPDTLTWKSGPHDCDGPWAKWWYHDVHKSSGWVQKSAMAPLARYRTVDPALMDALRASMPAYQFLRSQTASYKQQRPSSVYEDSRNEHVLVWIGPPDGGRLVPREFASISPWDSSVQGGDACWEGIRVYRGKILSLDKHLTRLFKSAKALGFAMSNNDAIHTRDQVMEAIFRTLAANGMRDGAHMRLTLTRGEKCTSSMNPKFNVYGTTLIILAEWKPSVGGATTYDNAKGISLISASQRRNPPSCVDSKIHHNNMINNILPKIQANIAGAEDAVMLDIEGYVSETNATNLFMVDELGCLLTPNADHCLPGITRQTVLDLAKELEIPFLERRISLAEFHSAEEVFTTGTMGELTPVTMIDGRVIGSGTVGNITKRLQDVYKTLPERPGCATEIPPFEGNHDFQ